VEFAYSVLECIHYEGERKGFNFNFDKFVEKHNKAFLELSHYGELEAKKVRDFLSRINAPEMAAAKRQACTTPALLANFQEAANFIMLSVTPLTIASRDIGALDTRTGTAIQAEIQTTATSALIAPYGCIRGQNLRERGRGGAFSPNAYG
jgi:hypothetical protein